MMENKEKDKYANLPHKEGIIYDYEEGIFGDAGPISIVFEGAIEQNFKMYSLNKFIYAKINEEKRIITGPAMRCDYKILDQDPKTGEYHTTSYNAQQIQEFAKLFSKGGYNRISNLQHSALATNGNWAYSFEVWQVADVENKMDKAFALGFEDVNVGDLYVSYFIEDRDMWEFIKKAGFKGFSIEAMVAMKLSEHSAKIKESEIERRIEEIAFDERFTDKYKEELIKKELGL